MIAATVIQHYIYVKGPCGKEANYCLDEYGKYSPISVWTQAIIYILGGIFVCFASITSLEYAFTKAPKNMRSLVQSVQLFTTAFSAALAQAFTPLTADPHIVWNYGSVAIISFVTGIAFHFAYRTMDKQEDALNLLPTGHLGTEEQAADVERRRSINQERRASLTQEKI